MKLKAGTVDLIAKYLLDLTKIIFAGIIFSNVIMKKYSNTYFIVIGATIFLLFFLVAIYLKYRRQISE